MIKSIISAITTWAKIYFKQSDWNEEDSSSTAFIKNKPLIPDSQIQSDWNQLDDTKLDFIKNKPYDDEYFLALAQDLGIVESKPISIDGSLLAINDNGYTEVILL